LKGGLFRDINTRGDRLDFDLLLDAPNEQANFASTDVGQQWGCAIIIPSDVAWSTSLAGCGGSGCSNENACEGLRGERGYNGGGKDLGEHF